MKTSAKPGSSPSVPSVIGILLVEDHPTVRDGLRTAIASQADMRVVGEAAGWREALPLARGLVPDVMVLDLNLPDGHGWSLLDELRAQGALPPTLVLSVCDEAMYARRLLRAGARGYLMKDSPIGQVLRAIQEIHAGHLAASPSLSSELMTEALAMAELPEPSLPAVPLSNRELQVLNLIAHGLPNKEIATTLGLSEKTVHTYKIRLMEKLGVQTTPELVACHRALHGPLD